MIRVHVRVRERADELQYIHACKNTSGFALNIVMKLMGIISVVSADFFMPINSGKGVFGTGNVK
jgi:hypothetical protein